MKRLVAFAAAAVALAACGADQPTQGAVLDKDHTEAWTETFYDPALKIPRTRHHPERWELHVCPRLDYEGECGWVDVRRQVWESTDVGDYWTREEH